MPSKWHGGVFLSFHTLTCHIRRLELRTTNNDRQKMFKGNIFCKRNHFNNNCFRWLNSSRVSAPSTVLSLWPGHVVYLQSPTLGKQATLCSQANWDGSCSSISCPVKSGNILIIQSPYQFLPVMSQQTASRNMNLDYYLAVELSKTVQDPMIPPGLLSCLHTVRWNHR